VNIEVLEVKKDEIENKIKSLLGENETGICGNMKITWKTYSRSSIDSKKLKAERPEIYNQYINNSSYRKFDVKEMK
jgi:predicted phage-related endonuclease